MTGSPNRLTPRQEPSWTQAPSASATVDFSAPTPPIEPSQIQQPVMQQPMAQQRSAAAPAPRRWVTLVLAIIGLLAIAYLLLRMVNVVEGQVARNQAPASSMPATVQGLHSGQNTPMAVPVVNTQGQ